MDVTTVPTIAAVEPLTNAEISTNQSLTNPVGLAPEAALPKVTTSSSHDYAHRFALTTSRANTKEPFTLMLTAEVATADVLQKLTEDELRELLYTRAIRRLTLTLGKHPRTFIAEAADFSAVACWEACRVKDAMTPQQIDDMIAHPTDGSSPRPHFANFVRKIEIVRTRHLYPLCQQSSADDKPDFWHLTMMARDPTVPYVKGAVRAIMAPFLETFLQDDKVPVWLEAGDSRVREIYRHFGFKDVEDGEIVVNGISTFCMIMLPAASDV